MTDRHIFDQRATALRESLRVKLGIRSTSLEQGLRRAGRLLPKSLRVSGKVLIDAQKKLPNPKIARQMDARSVDKAFQAIEAHLAAIDPKERRKDARLRWLAVLIINLVILSALMIALLQWRGLI